MFLRKWLLEISWPWSRASVVSCQCLGKSHTMGAIAFPSGSPCQQLQAKGRLTSPIQLLSRQQGIVSDPFSAGKIFLYSKQLFLLYSNRCLKITPVTSVSNAAIAQSSFGLWEASCLKIFNYFLCCCIKCCTCSGLWTAASPFTLITGSIS